MSLVGGLVAPHPPVVIPEVGGRRVREVQATLDSMWAVGDRARQLAPDTVVLLSPHAAVSAEHMGVGMATSYRGSLAYFGAPEIALEFVGDDALAEAILNESLSAGVPAARLGDGRAAGSLDHGALVPLYFAVGALPRPPRLVLLSFSLRSVEDHVEFGRAVGRAVDSSDRRVLYVASGDLSHRLTPDAPAGYNPLGEEFDQRVVEALRNDDLGSLLDIAPGILHAAGECGYRSLVVMVGLLEGRERSIDLLSYEGPFGVGYLVAWVDVSHAGAPDGDTGEAE